MKRYNQILIGLLVVQVALSVLAFWPKPTDAGGGEPLFPDLEGGDIAALSITDADGNSVQLRAVGGEWVLPDVDDYTAEAEEVTPVLEKIMGLDAGRLVTRTDSSHKRLQVAADDFVRRVDLETVDGTKTTIYVGSSPQYSATHFRLAEQSEVYLTSAFSAWELDATAASWIDQSYFSVSQDDITRVTLQNASGGFVFTRAATEDPADSPWTMDGMAEDETLAEDKVNLMIGQAASINMVGPLGREEQAAYGLDEPSALVKLEMGEEMILVRVGAQDAETNDYIVKASTEPYYVTVSQYGVNYLVENTREDFLQAPPTPGSEESTDTP